MWVGWEVRQLLILAFVKRIPGFDLRIKDEIRRIIPSILLSAAVPLSDLQKKRIVPGGQFDRYAYRTGQTVPPVRDAGQTTIRVKI